MHRNYFLLVTIVAPEMYGRPQVVKVKPAEGDLQMTLTSITLDMQVIDILRHQKQTWQREGKRERAYSLVMYQYIEYLEH